jgi:DNA-binding MarR family transcriptional regulator
MPGVRKSGELRCPDIVRISMERDHLDTILEQWSAEAPHLDVSPMGVIGRVSRLSRVMELRIERVFWSYGLSRGGFDVLAALRRSGRPYRLSPGDLQNSLLISSGAMTNRINRLEERGLVSRRPDPKDRRGIRVALTSKGRQLVDEVVAVHVQDERGMLGHLSEAEKADLAGLLRKLLINLDGWDNRSMTKGGHTAPPCPPSDFTRSVAQGEGRD